jgi:hypothetical protein
MHSSRKAPSLTHDLWTIPGRAADHRTILDPMSEGFALGGRFHDRRYKLAGRGPRLGADASNGRPIALPAQR